MSFFSSWANREHSLGNSGYKIPDNNYTQARPEPALIDQLGPCKARPTPILKSSFSHMIVDLHLKPLPASSLL